MTSSLMAEQGAPTEHKTSRRLLSRLRCGLQTRLLCTAGLSCKPSSASVSSSELPRRRVDSKLSSHIDTVSVDRKRLRSCDRKYDVVSSADSGVGRSLETPDSAVHMTSGYLTSGSPTVRTTYDVIGRRRKRCSTRLTTVEELDVPEPEMVTCSSNDVIGSPLTTRRRRKVPELREQLRYSTCHQFYGKWSIIRFVIVSVIIN